ncbi:MAG: hypothetical protein U5K33_01270 [Halofilum sp. (in: g-proteobacteria)]|nr:hypothetical protein [Halofilum sp. (in: g-proteobacteria)]
MSEKDDMAEVRPPGMAALKVLEQCWEIDLSLVYRADRAAEDADHRRTARRTGERIAGNGS